MVTRITAIVKINGHDEMGCIVEECLEELSAHIIRFIKFVSKLRFTSRLSTYCKKTFQFSTKAHSL